jgi:hypothetical protein
MLTQTDTVGRYRLIRLLGRGSFCAVYEALDTTTGERVALKQLRRAGLGSLSNFKREFRAVQGLHHPNVVELRELFEFAGTWFIAMELVEGVDLLSHVRNEQTRTSFDPVRVHDSFRQLSLALVALHAAGVIHRDIKPHNVLITSKGRVVLLDFGLVKTLDSATTSAADLGLGSALYMAPEQAAGRDVGPAADFYALGVCLYEALSGETPFARVTDSPFELMELKQRRPAPRLGANTAGASQALATLCMSLLECDPKERPTGTQVLATFDAETSVVAAVERFSGREHELDVLTTGFARSRAGSFELVLIEGESGIGKSALVAEFLDRLQRQEPATLVLRSRCYENELVAYKAFDSGMEQLAASLEALDGFTCRALLPACAVLLPRLFTAFGSVNEIVGASTQGVPADPASQRLLGFAAVSSLLANLAKRRPLVLAIDDLHWADAESFRLLRAIAEDPGRPALLIVATLHPKSELSEDAAAALAPVQNWSCTQSIVLEGLSSRDARLLAAQLLGPRANDELIDVLLTESRGHPLLLSELVRYAGTRNLALAPRITLDAALRERIDALSPDAERLMSTAALAARPYHAQLFATATGIAFDDLGLLATELLAAKLLRRRHGHELTCFHDRIRRVVSSRIDSERARSLHANLAAALQQQSGSDPAELARHHDAAGNPAAAIGAYHRAAQQAFSGLAFERAEEFCARALKLAAQVSSDASTRLELKIMRGHALARGGRSAEAARQYLEAADEAEDQDRTRLRLWAAQHLLQSARVEEGMAAASALLEELGIVLPSSQGGALARLVWDRACVRMHRLRISSPQGPISMHDRMRLDALWGLAMPVSWLDPLASAGLSARHLRLAQALGEPKHMARALAEEAFARTIQNPDNTESDTLLARARALCDADEDPALEVAISFREATVATFRWDLSRARERLEHALRLGTQSCSDQPWLLTNVRTNLASVWSNTGEHAKLASSCTAWLAEARDRGDQFALTMLESLGCGSFRFLMDDEPELGRAALAAALAQWPREPFAYAHFGEVIAMTYIGLYCGGPGAHDWLAHELPRLSRAFLLKTTLGKASLLTFRAYASLAARNTASADQARVLLAEIRAHLRQLKSIHSSLAARTVMSLEAQLAVLDGDLESALRHTLQLRARAESLGIFQVVHTLGYLEGSLEAGDGGQQKCAAALAFFAAQGWKQPRRAVAMLCPVIDYLQGSR